LARAHIWSRTRKAYHFLAHDRSLKDFRVLLDENMPPKAQNLLSRYFGQVVHVHDVGLTAKTDQDVIDYAIENQIDAILTRDTRTFHDSDLTKAAVNRTKDVIRAMDRSDRPNFSLSDLPVVLHFPGTRKITKRLQRFLNGRIADLVDYLDGRSVPYVRIQEDGIVDFGPTFLELTGQMRYQGREKEYAHMLDRREAFKDWVRAEIYRRKELSFEKIPTEMRQRIEALVSKAAAQCYDPYVQEQITPTLLERLERYKELKHQPPADHQPRAA
jgi:hypothetical protein